jgi:hypothetical protein
MAGYALNIDPLPTVEPIGAPGGDFMHVQASPEMFGGTIARALGTLGQGLENVANTGIDVARAQREMDDRTHGAELHTWFADQATGETEKFLEMKGRAAPDALEAHKASLNGLFNQALSQAKDPYTKLLLQQETRRTMDYQYQIAARHAAQQGAVWRSTTAKLASESAGDEAVLYATHGNLDAARQKLFASDQERRNHAEQEGYSGPPLDEAVRQNRGRNVVRAVESIARQEGETGGVKNAFDFYKSEEDNIDAGSRSVIEKFLHGELSTIAGRNIADEETGRAGGLSPGVAAVHRDAAEALGAQGITLNVTSGYRTPEHNAAVGGVRGSRHLRGDAIDVSLAGLSPAQQQAVIDQFLSDPRVGGFGYYPHSNSIHVDVRPGDRTAWGTDYSHTSIGEGWPEWLTDKVRAWQESVAPRSAVTAGQDFYDRAAVYDRIISRTQDHPTVQNAAVARMNQIFAVARDERTQGLALFNRRQNDTLTEVYVTGGVREPLTEDDFLQHRKPGQGEDEAREAYESYLADLRNGADRHAMESMPSADMRAMVEAADPTRLPIAPPGGMTRAAQRYAFLQKSMEEIEKKRRDDPGGAVARMPAVTEALRKYDLMKPETFRSVANATLAAQEMLGIPAEYRSPMTKDLALQMTASLRRILPGQERDTVGAVVERFEKMFGPDWPQAFTYALGVHSENQAVKEASAAVVRKYLKGQPVGPAEARQADQHSDVDAAESAVKSTAPAQDPFGMRRGTNPGRVAAQQAASQPQSQGSQESKQQQVLPPADDIVALRRNPALANRFDEKYGKGTAKKILDSYPSLGKQPPGAAAGAPR